MGQSPEDEARVSLDPARPRGRLALRLGAQFLSARGRFLLRRFYGRARRGGVSFRRGPLHFQFLLAPLLLRRLGGRPPDVGRGDVEPDPALADPRGPKRTLGKAPDLDGAARKGRRRGRGPRRRENLGGLAGMALALGVPMSGLADAPLDLARARGVDGGRRGRNLPRDDGSDPRDVKGAESGRRDVLPEDRAWGGRRRREPRGGGDHCRRPGGCGGPGGASA